MIFNPSKDTLEERRKVLAIKFGNNCLYNVKTQYLFPLRKKVHKLKTRKEEKRNLKY